MNQGSYLITLSAVILWVGIASAWFVTLRQARWGRYYGPCLITFMIGFSIFQGVSPTLTAIFGETHGFYIRDVEGSFATLCAAAIIFLACLLIGYRTWIWAPGRTVAWMLGRDRAFSARMLTVTSVLLSVVGVTLRMLVAVPFINDLAYFASIGCAATASGIIGWVATQRSLNVRRIALLASIVCANAVVVSAGSFGRRPLLAVVLGLLWGVLWGGWGRQSWKVSFRARAVAGVIAVSAFAALSLFSSTRQQAYIARERDAAQMLSAVASGDLRLGATMLLRGQDTGSASMWIIENYPLRFDYQYLQAPIYAFVYPVPRVIWPNKPWPLSNRLHYEAGFRVTAVSGSTRGPGIIGHAFAEGGWIVLMLYGLLTGALIRSMDRLAFMHSRNPLVVCAIASGLGQVMALPRGDSGAATWRYIFTVLASLAIVACLQIVVSWAYRFMVLPSKRYRKTMSVAGSA